MFGRWRQAGRAFPARCRLRQCRSKITDWVGPEPLFGDSLGVDAVAPGRGSQALLTMLYCSADASVVVALPWRTCPIVHPSIPGRSLHHKTRDQTSGWRFIRKSDAEYIFFCVDEPGYRLHPIVWPSQDRDLSEGLPSARSDGHDRRLFPQDDQSVGRLSDLESRRADAL